MRPEFCEAGGGAEVFADCCGVSGVNGGWEREGGLTAAGLGRWCCLDDVGVGWFDIAV